MSEQRELAAESLAYFETFHRVYCDLVDRYVPRQHRDRLSRYHLLRIRHFAPNVYFSRTYGVAIHYEQRKRPPQVTTASVIEILFPGSWRLRKLPQEAFRITVDNARRLQFKGVEIEGRALVKSGSVNIENSRFITDYPLWIEGDNSFVRLAQCLVENSAAARLIYLMEIYTGVDSNEWSTKAAEADATREVMAAVVQCQAAATTTAMGFYEAVRVFRDKSVLVLGDFGEDGRRRLDAVRQALPSEYRSFVLDEVPDLPEHDLGQKFRMYASISRFLVFENSGRSGHLVELEIARNSDMPRVILNEAGQRRSFMVEGHELSSKVAVVREYTATSLPRILSSATRNMEAVLRTRSDKLNRRFPWRETGSAGGSDTHHPWLPPDTIHPGFP